MGAGVFDGRRSAPGVGEHTDARALKIARRLSPFDPYPICEKLSGLGGDEPPALPAGGLHHWIELTPDQQLGAAKVIYKGGNLLLVHRGVDDEALLAIAAFVELRKMGRAHGELVAVVPTSPRVIPFIDALETCTTRDMRYRVVTYDRFCQDPEEILSEDTDTLIYDSLQSLDSGVLKTLRAARRLHTNFIGLIYAGALQSSADLVPLVDVMTDGDHLLGDKSVFEARFKKNPIVMEALLSPYVHYVGGKTPVERPKEPLRDMNVEESRAK